MRRYAVVLLAVVVIAGALGAWRVVPHPDRAAGVDPSYATTIQPLFDRRCVPCHACFDSPCQLNLQSFEGLDRGSNKDLVYHPNRLAAARPTRMFQDAQTTRQWQSSPFDFFSVVDRRDAAEPEQSVFWRFVAQRSAYADEGASRFDVDTTTTCPATPAETERELHDFPQRGMPFGFPAIARSESDAIATWLRNGAGGPAAAAPESDALATAIAQWEALLDAPDDRSRLVAAYLFEHLFYAHLYFDVAPGAWFRIVRSRKMVDGSIDEIATRRPYDDPGEPFTYRLRRIRETIVEKTHVPYLLSDAKLAHLRQLFAGDWKATVANPYDPKVAANPFLAFADIPARARYQFMLDDARYHVQTFIHGPVCRGQAALDVIDEHFLIFFLAPDSDPAVTDPAYLARVAPLLAVPADDAGKIEEVYDALVLRHAGMERKYLAAALPSVKPRSLADVWNGDGNNPHAVLTVYRHFDNAFVLDGALGGTPKTAWVMDYPIFERMYYDLVAGFDVYGNVIHQVATRVYQNLLRIEAEGQLLRLLPTGTPNVRTQVHESWYRGRIAEKLADIHAASYEGPDPLVTYDEATAEDAKRDLIARLLTKQLPAAVVGPREPIQWRDVPLSSDPARAHFETLARELVKRPAATAPDVSAFPDVTLLRVRPRAGADLVYTVVRNRSHLSVEFIWPEAVELEPQEDTLQVVPGIATSRPNLLLVVNEDDLDAFAAAWRGLKAPAKDGKPDATWVAFVAKYGARRSDPGFWSTYDAFGDAFHAMDPVGAGVLDLSRYGND
jgi:hypothetical protein